MNWMPHIPFADPIHSTAPSDSSLNQIPELGEAMKLTPRPRSRAAVALAATAVAALAVTLTGCSTGAASDGVVEITFANFYTGPDKGTMDELVKEFNTTHPKIKVTNNAIDGTTLATELPSLVAAGKAPDVEASHEVTLPQLAAQGAVQALDESELSDAGIKADDYFSTAWNAGKQSGELYGVPFAGSSAVMFYNNAAMKTAGVTEVPQTLDQLVTAGQACTTDAAGLHPDEAGFDVNSIQTYGGGFPVEWGGPVGNSVLAQFGGTLWNKQGDVDFDSAAGVEALTALHTLVYDTVIGPPGIGFEADLANFRAGKSCFLFTGGWEYNGNVEAKMDFGAAFWPTIGEKQAANGGWNWLTLPGQKGGYPKEKRAASLEFVKWMTSKAAGETWVTTGNLPARPDVAESDEYAANPMSEVAVNLESLFVATGVPWTSQVSSGFTQAYTKIMSTKDVDVKAELEKAAKQAQADVDAARPNYPDYK
jgi:multiple sugar transport system substrate-binding protein